MVNYDNLPIQFYIFVVVVSYTFHTLVHVVEAIHTLQEIILKLHAVRDSATSGQQHRVVTHQSYTLDSHSENV